MVIISKVPIPQGEDINSLLQGHEEGILQDLLSKREVLNGVSKGKAKEEGGEKAQAAPQGKLDVSNPRLISYHRPPLLFSLLGGLRLENLERLRVTLKVERYGVGVSGGRLRHSFDLYNDDQLERYARKAADRLDMGSEEMRVRLKCLGRSFGVVSF